MIGGKYDLHDRFTHECTYMWMTQDDDDWHRCPVRVPYWTFMCVEHGKLHAVEGETYYFSGQAGVLAYRERLEYPDIFMNRHINGVPSDAHG